MTEEIVAAMSNAWVVYFIECRTGSIYTGITTDVSRRYQQHATGKGARFTRMNPPVRLLGSVAFETRGAALRAEAWVKRMPARAKRKHILALLLQAPAQS